MNKINFVFFGTSQFSILVLGELKRHGYLPSAIVTFPDKPANRRMVLTPNPVKLWGEEHNIKVIEALTEIPEADIYIVASYGKILPKELIDKPKFKTLNVHPSLLPRLRGASPIQTAILQEDNTGVTIMRMNEKMDEGPIVAQQEVIFENWPNKYSVIEETLAKAGGELLAELLPKWIKGEIHEVEQNHPEATYTKKIKKEDSEISKDRPEMALRKIYAYEVWPRARLGNLIVTDAHIEDGKLVFDKVIPPGKKEMSYEDYLRGKH